MFPDDLHSATGAGARQRPGGRHHFGQAYAAQAPEHPVQEGTIAVLLSRVALLR